jgi:hypothetical protein
METSRRGIEPIDYQGMVEEFMKTSGQDVYTSPREMTLDQAKLRYDLYIEELEELKAAITSNDRVEQLDALCDIVYILLGTALTRGKPVSKEGMLSRMKQLATMTFTPTSVEQYIGYLAEYSVEQERESLSLVIPGLCFSLGFTHLVFQEAFKRVHASNMSKFIGPHEDSDNDSTKTISDTISMYKNRGVETYTEEVNGLMVVKRHPDGKILKSINYKPVNLEDLV